MQEHTPYTSGVRSQRPRRISVFDGQDLKKAMLAGAASLEEHREIINALNVFPVPDGDTGSNLYATVQAAFRAVIKPVEGTILTVVRETAEAAMASAKRGDDLVMMMQESIIAARQSVARTPDLLPTLKQAGVVDAGGQGFCTILEGVWRYVRGESGQVTTASFDSTLKKGRVKIEEEFGYEVVFLLRGEKLDVEGIRQSIIDMGGVSTVVAGDEKMLKIHTHTEWPGKILDYGVSIGSLLDINIENLQEQSLTYAAESEAEHTAEEMKPVTQQIATVAVVAGQGFEG